MDQTFEANDVFIGFHPDGYKIDKTAEPAQRYTKWQVSKSNRWSNPQPITFRNMPGHGWFKKDRFDWDRMSISDEVYAL